MADSPTPMADSQPYSETGQPRWANASRFIAGVRRSATGLPRWATVSVFIVGVLLWAFVLMPSVLVPLVNDFGSPAGSGGHTPPLEPQTTENNCDELHTVRNADG